LLFSGVALIGGFMLITQKNPAHAALSFTLVIIATCGLFLLNAAPFLMAATLIIYAGAIIVTFLFVIMLAQQAGLSDADARSREPFLSCLAGFILMAAMMCVIQRTYAETPLNEEMDKMVQRVDPVIDKAQRIVAAKTMEEARAVLVEADDPDPIGKIGDFQDWAKRYFPPDEWPTLENFEFLMNGDRLDEARGIATLIATRARQWKEMVHEQQLKRGSLYQPGGPPEGMQLRPIPQSPFSGVPSHVGPAVDPATGQVRERMPAANVEALGRALMTDYLIPMLAAGMLLLVATIGAIAIAARRGEVLR
jgi:NADH:ubiquinone oxidoreductase subunit 6 (subunit J)